MGVSKITHLKNNFMQFGKCLTPLCTLLIALMITAKAAPAPDMMNFLPDMENVDMDSYGYGPDVHFYLDNPENDNNGKHHRRGRRSIPTIPLRYQNNGGNYGFVKCKLFQWKTPTSCRF